MKIASIIRSLVHTIRRNMCFIQIRAEEPDIWGWIRRAPISHEAIGKEYRLDRLGVLNVEFLEYCL